MTPEQRLDPDFTPKLSVALPLSLQHILAMFVSNVTPALIIAGAAGFGPSNGTSSEVIYMIQTAMLFAGAATLLQTVTAGPVGARLPIVQGTSFAFLPIMLPIAATGGYEAMAILTAGCVIGGLFHALLGFFVGRVRLALPPLVTGLVVAMIGLSLVKVGIQYAAGGAALSGTSAYGSWESWSLAGIVIAVTFGFNFFGRGLWASAAVLIGLAAGYAAALAMGRVDFLPLEDAGWIALPEPFHFGFTFSAGAVLGFCLMGIVSAIETIGDVSALTETGARREATDKELAGATFADGLGTALAGLFGALPNTSFSQNIAVVSMTGIMSRHIVTLGGCILILCGLVPKIGALIITVPVEVLGGGVIIMFGMIAAAAISILSKVTWTQRNMLIFAVSLSLGLGLQQEPAAVQQLPEMAQVLLTSGLLPAAFLAVFLNSVLPKGTAITNS